MEVSKRGSKDDCGRIESTKGEEVTTGCPTLPARKMEIMFDRRRRRCGPAAEW